MTASLSEASKLFDFDSCFVDIRSSAAGLAFEGEVGDAVRVLEHVHTADLLSIHVLAAVAQAYRNLVVRNKSFMDSADSFDVIMSSLKNALSAAESKAEQYKRDNNNLLGEYTALGTLHQQVKTDSIGVESRLNMRIGDLMQDLITLRTENEGLRVAKEQLTQDAADLCALLESRDGEVLSVDQLRSASEKDQIELIQLRRKVSELSDELNQLSSKHATECSSLATLKEDAELTAHKTVFELAETSSELHRMKLELKRMREEMISVQEEKDEALSDYATLAASSQKDRAAAADSEHALRAQIAELHEQIKRLRTSELESDLRTITEELQQVKADLVLRTTQLAATASDRAKLEKELADCQSDLAESVDRVSVLKKTLQAESSYAETHEKGEQNQIAELSRRLKETEDKEAAVSRESQQSISELTKTCQALQARLKELSAGSNSLALREAFSSLDQTATLPEVAAWLTTQIQEHPDVIDAAGTGGERGALRTKILEIHTTTENSVKSLRSEIKRLSSSQVVMEKSLVEARELQQEYSDLCEVLKSEKLKLQKKIDTHNDIDAYGSMQSDMISSPVRNFPSGDEDNNLSFSEPIVFVEIGNYECRVGLWDNVHSCFSKRYTDY